MPLSSLMIAVACSGELNGFVNVICAEPSAARAHGCTVHPCAARSPRRTRSSSFPPPDSAAFTASGSRTAATVTTPVPSSCMVTVTVVSTLHAAASSMTANATRTSRIRLVLERCVAPVTKESVAEELMEEEIESLLRGAGAGELHRRGLDALDGPEHDLVVERVDHDRLPGVEFLPQDLLRERILDHPLDR